MPSDELKAAIREVNSEYFRTLSESMERQLTGAAGRILKKAEAKILRLEARVAELESRLELYEATLETKIQQVLRNESRAGGCISSRSITKG